MRIVLTTIDTREGAETLGRAIVQSRLGACVNIIEHVRSIYWWDNEVQEANELVLVIKTTPELVDDLQAFIVEHHPYDLPEFVVLDSERVSGDYMEWIRSSTR